MPRLVYGASDSCLYGISLLAVVMLVGMLPSFVRGYKSSSGFSSLEYPSVSYMNDRKEWGRVARSRVRW